MSTFIIKFLFIFFVFFELSIANELPVLDLPEEFDSSWISQNMEFNGVPMNIKSFSTSLSYQKAKIIMTKYLNSLGGQQIESKNNEWITLGTSRDNLFYSFQVIEQSNVVSGFFTVSLYKKNKKWYESKKYPKSLYPIENQIFKDSNVTHEFEVLKSNDGLNETKAVISNMLMQQGWEKNTHQIDGRLIFYKDKSEAQVFFDKDSEPRSINVLISTEYVL